VPSQQSRKSNTSARRTTAGDAPTDSRLVQEAIARAQAGDAEGLHFLYVRFASDVQRFVNSLVHDHHESEDITQNVFAKLMTRIQKYEQREVPFAAWILRVARNAALDHLREPDPGIEALIVANEPVPLNLLPALRLVANYGVGYDRIDLAACAERGVVVTNTPGVLDAATADLAFAHELADVAAEVTLAWFGGRLPVDLKADATPVTEVDRKAERAIRDAIAARFPDDGVLGEEEGSSPGSSGRRWIVDPVDGTRPAAAGLESCAVSIGVVPPRDDATLGEAVDAMADHRIHAVLVVDRDSGTALGWITARGLLGRVGCDAELPAVDAIDEKPRCIEPEATLRAALYVLALPGVTRLLVRPRDGGAGGPVTPDKDTDVEVIRIDLRELQAGALSQNVTLRDSDTIIVPRAQAVYVFGQVKSPGAFPIERDTTVLQALSLAGGVTDRGSTGRIKIVRTVDGKKKEIKVKLTDVVEPGDTLIVAERFF